MLLRSPNGRNKVNLKGREAIVKELPASRRDFARGCALGLIGGAIAPAPSLAAPALPSLSSPDGGLPLGEISPSILSYLGDLDAAANEIANTWRPGDRKYRADIYRQIMMSLSFSYFAYFHADAEHPDWSPLWNPVYTLQPNPDDIYLYSPIRGDLTYRVSGNRGTCKILSFTTVHGLPGMVDTSDEIGHRLDIDDRDIEIGPTGDFELLFSAERPAGYVGNWTPIDPAANLMMIRARSYDWGAEADPRLSIECLSPVGIKAPLTPEEVIERIRLMAKFPVRSSHLFYNLQNALKARVGVNVVELQRTKRGLSKQVYWPAAYQFSPGEALIIETELPGKAFYWNIQINDPYFNAVEYVYRFSSLNGATAKVGPDGKLRAVIALEDPGVPNWLDTAGFTEGTLYGRWYDCDSSPQPTIKRIPLKDLRAHLPTDTPHVTKEQRAEALSSRVRAAQRRRRW
jgi:hypothetical protein